MRDNPKIIAPRIQKSKNTSIPLWHRLLVSRFFCRSAIFAKPHCSHLPQDDRYSLYLAFTIIVLIHAIWSVASKQLTQKGG